MHKRRSVKQQTKLRSKYNDNTLSKVAYCKYEDFCGRFREEEKLESNLAQEAY